MTSTLIPGQETQLPPAAAIGEQKAPFPIVGRGAARVLSPPIQPQFIMGRWYVAIDMGTDGTRFDPVRPGLMNLYGQEFSLDVRRLTGFVRSISAVSEEEARSWGLPQRLARFPEDLRSGQTEYSGIYEDG